MENSLGTGKGNEQAICELWLVVVYRISFKEVPVKLCG